MKALVSTLMMTFLLPTLAQATTDGPMIYPKAPQSSAARIYNVLKVSERTSIKSGSNVKVSTKSVGGLSCKKSTFLSSHYLMPTYACELSSTSARRNDQLIYNALDVVEQRARTSVRGKAIDEKSMGGLTCQVSRVVTTSHEPPEYKCQLK